MNNVSTKQRRIAELAKQSPQMSFTSLAYMMDVPWLQEAYRRTRRDGAVGVNGVTAVEYEKRLDENLQSLLDRAKSETFDLLGFTHYWTRNYKGNLIIRRKTMRKRLARAIHSVREWCRLNRHNPIKEQYEKLVQKVRGHYAYYGITGNAISLGKFHCEVERSWRFWLDRRNSERSMTWDKFQCLLQRHPLPQPRIVHSFVRKT